MTQKIGIGFQEGHLTVSRATDERKNGYTVWLCRCDCGGEIALDTRTLQRGTVTDCGCRTLVRPGMLDLTGQRFGKLICLSLHPKKNSSGGTQWLCRCDCGNECIASVSQLRAGYKKSCGCLSHPSLKNFVGKRFSLLTVVEYAGKIDGMHRWKCLCDCGNETIVGQTLLQSGKTRSCGCLRSKIGDGDMRGLVDGTSVSVLKARLTRPPIATNSSGYNGVYRNQAGKWVAQITFKHKTRYLGSFTSLEDAVLARKRGEVLFSEFLEEYYKTRSGKQDERVSSFDSDG